MLLTLVRTIRMHPQYLLLGVAVSFVVFTFAVWLPNTKLILALLTSDIGSFWDRLSVVFSLYGSIATNFTVISASYTIAIAILFGINIALLTYYIRTVHGGLGGIRRTGAAGIGGLVIGIFGIGCAACGTFILTSALALFGASGILIFLPFGGEELGFLGVGLLVYSIYAIAKKIGESQACDII